MTIEEKEKVWIGIKQMLLEDPKAVSEKLQGLFAELRKAKFEKIVEEDFIKYNEVFKALA